MTPDRREGVLAGRTAVITGAGSGIGAAIARAFAEEGVALHLADVDQPGLDRTVAEVSLLGSPVSTVVADVSDAGESATVISSAIADHGRIDILVNCAGIQTQTPFLEMAPEVFDRIVAVDLRGVFLCSRWAAPHMVERGAGRIINVSSQLAIKGGRNLAHYTAAKAGVIGLTKSMALELAPHNVLVNAIAPGPVHTPIMNTLDAEWVAAKRSELPLGRFGLPEEVAPTAVMLASDPGGNLYVGQTLGPNSGDVMP